MRSAPHPGAEIVLWGGKRAPNPMFAFGKTEMQVSSVVLGKQYRHCLRKAFFTRVLRSSPEAHRAFR